MQDFEQLGSFFLGKRFDPDAGETTDELLMYDAKDLTTHAMCVGMTGSGKTGLCIGLLEEAAIDGIPAIIIDPKGDMGNLMLTFPKLRGEDFEPWIDPAEATRKGSTVTAHATKTAKKWKEGLASWGQDAARIRNLKKSAEVAIYTPGSTAGLPLTVLKSFDAPSNAIREDREAMNDRISSAVSGLLALLGIDADPIQSREHILMSNILNHAWSAGRSLSLADMILEIQNPPFQKLGVFDLESFYSAKERFKLSMQLNNVIASPGFQMWTEGESLDISKLMYTAEGKPRLCILSIAHLSEKERMFFVTILLNEVVSWMRSQSGTSSLRAILYMDEIFGYFPPTANPPSKKPMLTLLKQARAYGVGCVLATQNPVDLDYKGLSNTGTWFIGRLQTERDKMRVLDGLEGASASAGQTFNRKKMETIISGLGSRVFLLNNVHDDEPVLFNTRWVMSYLRGPLTRDQIGTLMAPMKKKRPKQVETAAASGAPASSSPAAEAKPARTHSKKPVLPPGIEQRYLKATRPPSRNAKLLYRPALVGTAQLHFVSAKSKIDDWNTLSFLNPIPEEDMYIEWTEATRLSEDKPKLYKRAELDADFAELPSLASRKKSYTSWEKSYKTHLYQNMPMTVWHSPDLKVYSKPNISEGEFRGELKLHAREKRDIELEKLRKKYAPKLQRLEQRIRKAQERINREQEQYDAKKMDTMISVGATVLGAIFGRRRSSGIGRATTAARGASRTAKERSDIGRAEDELQAQHEMLADMEMEFNDEKERIRELTQVDELEVNELLVKPRKSDITILAFGLTWVPWQIDSDGIAEPLF